MADSDITTEQRGVNRRTAAILTRVICPEKADWPESVARELLRLRFADTDLNRFHGLLAGAYGATLTEIEDQELESYMFVNCLLALIHDRARQSLGEIKENKIKKTMN